MTQKNWRLFATPGCIDWGKEREEEMFVVVCCILCMDQHLMYTKMTHTLKHMHFFKYMEEVEKEKSKGLALRQKMT